MSYRKVLEESGVYLWIYNSSKRLKHKRSEQRRKQRIYKKLERKIRRMNGKRKQKEKLLKYLHQLR